VWLTECVYVYVPGLGCGAPSLPQAEREKTKRLAVESQERLFEEEYVMHRLRRRAALQVRRRSPGLRACESWMGGRHLGCPGQGGGSGGPSWLRAV
jgi:hypothetical protein